MPPRKLFSSCLRLYTRRYRLVKGRLRWTGGYEIVYTWAVPADLERELRSVALEQLHAALVRIAALERQLAALREENRRIVRAAVAS